MTNDWNQASQLGGRAIVVLKQAVQVFATRNLTITERRLYERKAWTLTRVCSVDRFERCVCPDGKRQNFHGTPSAMQNQGYRLDALKRSATVNSLAIAASCWSG